MLPEMQAVFGMDLVLKEQDDLFALAQKAAALPKELRPGLTSPAAATTMGTISSNRTGSSGITCPPCRWNCGMREFPGATNGRCGTSPVERAIPFFLGSRGH